MKPFTKLCITAIALASLPACETTNGTASKMAEAMRGGGAICIITPSLGGGTTQILAANQDQEKGRRGGKLSAECQGAKLTIESSGPEPTTAQPKEGTK